jgi:predicted DCC family thiol-disulfide oxidoreductase YuxK
MKHGDSRAFSNRVFSNKHDASRVFYRNALGNRQFHSITQPALPDFIQPGHKIVMFDAVCKLCTGWSRFLIRHDVLEKFKLCSVQSPQGQAILKSLGMPTDHFDTMLLIEGHQVYERSDALLRIMQQLPFPFSVLAAGRIIPKAWRDWTYDQVASRRYTLFGQHAQCMAPTPQIRKRFLDHAI